MLPPTVNLITVMTSGSHRC